MNDNTVQVELKILCVLGTVFNRDLKRLLQGSDSPHVTDFIFDAYKALQICKENLDKEEPYDLILIEYSLAEMTGIELTKRIRNIDSEVLLVLLPTFYLCLEEVQREYDSFGGFFLKLDFATHDYNEILNLVIEYKLKHFIEEPEKNED